MVKTTDLTGSISALRSAVADIEQVILLLERLALSTGIAVALAQSVSGIENHHATEPGPAGTPLGSGDCGVRDPTCRMVS